MLNSSGNTWPQSPWLAKPLWTDPEIKSGVSVRLLMSTKKKKAKKLQLGNEWSSILPKSSLARKKPPCQQQCSPVDLCKNFDIIFLSEFLIDYLIDWLINKLDWMMNKIACLIWQLNEIDGYICDSDWLIGSVNCFMYLLIHYSDIRSSRWRCWHVRRSIEFNHVILIHLSHYFLWRNILTVL